MGAQSYMEQRDGGYWMAGSRVSLDSLVYAFREGQTIESLAQSFPVLTLEQVCRAIILSGPPGGHRAYLRQQEADFA